jgi:hypothetical protein
MAEKQQGIALIREKFPQYDGVPDAELAFAIHQKYYSGTPLGLWTKDANLEPDLFRQMVGIAGQKGVELSASTQTPQETKRGFQETAIQQNPVAARVATGLQGVPYAGEYVDEAIGNVFGEDAQSATRMLQQSMAETRPKETMALQAGTGIAATLPIALPLALEYLPASLGGKLLAGSLTGAGFGATEGLVSGYGSGETDKERSLNAQQRALIGSKFGAGFGLAAPTIGAGIGAVAKSGALRPIQEYLDRMKAKGGAADLLGMAAEMDKPFTDANIAAAGQYGNLASTGPNMSILLDAAATTMGRSSADARLIVEQTAKEAGVDLTNTLNTTFGKPSGIETVAKNIMKSSANGRNTAYNKAYAATIDYASDAGSKLEGLIGRVDQNIINQANKIMKREGNVSSQIKLTFDKDGNAIESFLPDVRQWDYISRALHSVDPLANPLEKNSARGLASEIRTTVDKLVPEYKNARGTAGDVIGQIEALDVGKDFLRSTTTREEVALALKGMNKKELNNVKSGLRYQLDEVMANAGRTLTDSNEAAREALLVLKSLTTRASKDKFQLLLGKKEADVFAAKVDEVYSALAQRASIAIGSKTAVRQGAKEFIGESITPSFADNISQKGLFPALSGSVAPVLQMGGKTISQRQREMLSEMAPILAGRKTQAQLLKEVEDLQKISPRLDFANALQQVVSNTITTGGLLAVPTVTKERSPTTRIKRPQ